MNHQDELPLAKVSEVDEAKRQWLQGMRHPVDTVTEPEPAEILAEFIRQHSAAVQLQGNIVNAFYCFHPVTCFYSGYPPCFPLKTFQRHSCFPV